MLAQIAQIPFHKLEEHHFSALAKIYSDSRYTKDIDSNQGYLYDDMVYPRLKSYSKPIGRIFFISLNREYIGFLSSFDSFDLPSNTNYPIGIVAGLLKHEWPFVEDLSHIGSFAFVDQFALLKEYRGKIYGNLLFAEFEKYAMNSNVALIGSTVHEKNRKAQNFLDRRKYRYVDYYPSSKESWWYRMVQIVDKKAFATVIKTPSPNTHFSTTIPMRLNRIGRKVNLLLSDYGGKIIWSSFFHFQNQTLSKIFRLKNNYNAHYEALPNAEIRDFEEVRRGYKRLLTYLDQKDDQHHSGVASISESLLRKKYEVFIINDATENHAFPSFDNPQVFDLNSLTLEQVREIFDLAKWDTAPPVSANLTRQNDYQLSQIKEADWAEWIDLHKSGCELELKSTTDSGNGEGLWCHAIIPFSFGDGFMGVMFTFVLPKRKTFQKPELVNNLAYIIHSAFAKNLIDLALQLQRKISSQYLIRFAISNIMTRNLSHNIGSHVLAKVSSIETLRQYVKKDGQCEITGLEEIARFSAYVRTRMDFLADVSTSEPVTSVSRLLFREVIQKFKKEVLVLKNIVLNDIKITIREDCQLKELKDVYIQIPNGDLGNHAIYTILENMIRNIVKHENWLFANHQTLDLCIKVENDQNDRFPRGYRIIIHDFFARSLEQIDPVLDKLNTQQINGKAITEGYRIRSYGWGVLEMKIAASYLRKKLPANFLDDFSLNPPLLKAVKVEAGKSMNYYLGYEIYLKKPREILIIDSSIAEVSRRWRNRGIRKVSVEELGKRQSTNFTQAIVLMLEDCARERVEKEKIFPLRWIYLKDKVQREELRNRFSKSDPERFIAHIWGVWLNKILDGKGCKKPELIKNLDNSHKKKSILQNIENVGLLYDHHAGAARADKQGPALVDPAKFRFYEAFKSPSPIGRLLLEDPSSNENKYKTIVTDIQLIEAALMRILILDERIQREASGTTPSIRIGNSSTIDQLKWMNIHMPVEEELNLSTAAYGERFKEQLVTWLDQKLTEENTDFLVIHLGILEKLMQSDREKMDAFISKFQRNDLEIICISGRGRPPYLPIGTTFLNYSNLVDYLLENRSKYHLCKVLFSARSRNGYYE